MRNRRTVAAGAAIGVGLLAGCGHGVGGNSASTASSPAPRPSVSVPGLPFPVTYLGAVAGSTSNPEVGVNLSPPSADATPGDVSAALQHCRTGEAVCDPAVAATVRLGQATATSAGDVDSSGTLVPLMKDRLVFVLEQDGTACLPVGPPGRTPSATEKAMICNLVSFFDATTGKVLYDVRYPAG